MEVDFARMPGENTATLDSCPFSLLSGCSSVGGDWGQYFWKRFRIRAVLWWKGATLSLVNTALKNRYQAASDRLGFYSFPKSSPWAITI